jgi:hypothetical protein
VQWNEQAFDHTHTLTHTHTQSDTCRREMTPGDCVHAEESSSCVSAKRCESNRKQRALLSRVSHRLQVSQGGDRQRPNRGKSYRNCWDNLFASLARPFLRARRAPTSQLTLVVVHLTSCVAGTMEPPSLSVKEKLWNAMKVR